ncbi:MAG: hypothetical protein KF856_06005 [Cyclobacteriaceae bacterium]|nr:hypothetical protein [Cyclobacteriaceae bacterium]
MLFASTLTSQPARQSFVKWSEAEFVNTFKNNDTVNKELAKPTHRKIELKKISYPSENKKYAIAQTNTTQKLTAKLKIENGLQTRTTEHQLPTAVLQKWRFSASYDSFVVGSSSVLRLKFSGKNRHLRKAAKRWRSCLRTTQKSRKNIQNNTSQYGNFSLPLTKD